MVDLHCHVVDMWMSASDSYANTVVLIFDGHVEMRDFFFNYLVVIWVSTILNHIDTTTTILPRYQGSTMVYRLKSY